MLKELIVTKEELDFIQEEADKIGLKRTVDVAGFLMQIRRDGLTLEEVFQRAMAKPGNEEHHEAFRRQRDFLAERVKKFNIR